jgi:ABC-type lipoprotein export system ATPase subunit
MHLELDRITKQYNGNRPVLDNITLTISEGSSLAIVGPSGSGKSTLLNLLGTLDLPSEGEVRINGKSTCVLTANELNDLRNKKIGFVFQTHLLLPQLTTLENVLLPVIPRDKNYQKLAPERAKQMLDFVGLSDKINRLPGEMSVGECQRVAVIRALINEPELLLTDEPTGSLDHDSAASLGEMLIRLHNERKFTLIAVTHSSDLAGLMDKTYKLVNGKISVNSTWNN